jgi:hypothetical protein
MSHWRGANTTGFRLFFLQMFGSLREVFNHWIYSLDLRLDLSLESLEEFLEGVPVVPPS